MAKSLYQKMQGLNSMNIVRPRSSWVIHSEVTETEGLELMKVIKMISYTDNEAI